VRFVEFLRTTVLLSAGAATLLAVLTVISATDEFDPVLVWVAASWWSLAVLFGIYLGRRTEVTPAITRILASARSTTVLPELRPWATLLNRLWPLLLFTLIAGVVGFFLPQVAAIATGFALIWPLSIRHQEKAVAAIEERDAVRFYIDKTSPVAPMTLIRTPGFGGDFLAMR
jgi:hypothetical protein